MYLFKRDLSVALSLEVKKSLCQLCGFGWLGLQHLLILLHCQHLYTSVCEWEREGGGGGESRRENIPTCVQQERKV